MEGEIDLAWTGSPERMSRNFENFSVPAFSPAKK